MSDGAIPKTLPIYRLTPARATAGTIHALAGRLLGVEKYSLRHDGERLSLRSGSKLLEVYRHSGGIWAADEARMWKPELAPKLPDEKEAIRIAEGLCKKHGLLPAAAESDPFRIDFKGVGGTWAAFLDAEKKKRDQRRLDVQVNYGTTVHLRGDGGQALALPVVGGGGDFNVTLGEKGELIGYSGVWRRIAEVAEQSPVISRQAADDRFRKLMKSVDLESFDSFLAYYSAPASVEQEYLHPVYVYRAHGTFGGRKVPLRMVLLPATKFGPELPKPPVQKKRGPKQLPKAAARAQAKKLPGAVSLRRNFWEEFFEPYFEAGTSWIGTSGGLTGSHDNAQGFVDGLSADGWNINFNWGDGNAWESDWDAHDEDWVDATDFVFYTGHASMDGWVLRPPVDDFLHYSEVTGAPAVPGELWGDGDVEWIIVAACGPLQDEVISAGGGDVFSRWSGAFNGLHQLLGYGAITFDNTLEGATVVKYARDGQTLIDAWFRAAREIQPATNGASPPDGPNIWVGVMYPYHSGAMSPGDDHIFGHGSVAPDPIPPHSGFVAMWTTT